MNHSSYYSYGKLLLTGEYLILNGATSLAVPTKKGQKMVVKHESHKKDCNLIWTSYNYENKIWFETIINYKNWEIKYNNNNEFTDTLLKVLIEANNLSHFFDKHQENIIIETHLEFPNNWGLGSSSTFINNIAQWLSIDAFTLLFKSFGGSGYDIGCAQNNTPILYTLKNHVPIIKKVNFKPSFYNQLYFVYLNTKQSSKVAIENYKKKKITQSNILFISDLTEKILKSDTIDDFCLFIDLHEKTLSNILDQPTVKERLFNNYSHSIKSLGAWGGDFIMVIAKDPNDLNYFKEKGYNTILTFDEILL